MSRILIVDDDAFVGSAIQITLARENHDAVFFQNAASGIAALALSKFDLAIIDIFLTGTDGLTLIATARCLAPTLPIIVMTGSKVQEFMRLGLDLRDLAIKAGATYCLRKPVGTGQLLVAVNSSLNPPYGGVDAPIARDEIPPAPAIQIEVAESAANESANLAGNTIFDDREREAEDVATAAVTYQFKQPLRVLRRYLHEMQMESDGDSTSLESTRALIKCAMHETERARGIIDLVSHPKLNPHTNRHVVTPRSDIIDVAGFVHNNQGTRLSGRGRLTPRERQVLDLVIQGASNKSGAYQLSISVRTFEVHRANIMEKFGARNAADLCRLAASYAA